LAESDGRLVALRVFMRWSWRARGATVPAVRAVDTATHPAWRRRGIFTRLTLALLNQVRAEGAAFVFNTPNSQSRRGYLKMGWASLGRMSLWFSPLRPLRLARALLSSTTAGKTVEDAEPGAQDGASAAELLRQPELARFLSALPERPDRFATLRTCEYLRWRYVTIPGIDYRAAWSLEGDDGTAVIFRYKHTGGIRELRLCELLVGITARSRRMARDLLQVLLRGAAAHYATGMAVSGTPEQRVLVRCGFLPAPRVGPIMTVRPLNAMTSNLDPLRRSHWRLSIGDLELF
jgi:hypothetical protein